MNLRHLVPALISTVAFAAEPAPIPAAINALGLDLYRAQAAASSEGNLLLSPYSIQTALAMTYAGAEGETRAEMQRVLHLPADDEGVHGGFGALVNDLKKAAAESKERAANATSRPISATPLEINVANRLFGQDGYAFRQPFLALLADRYAAPLERLDFLKDPEPARKTINGWVDRETRGKIRDVVPLGALTKETRLALANAIYMKAAWTKQFTKRATKDERFLVRGQEGVNVPTMVQKAKCGYAKNEGNTVVTLPYDGGVLQFVIVLPDSPNGLAEVERALTPAHLASYAQSKPREVVLHLPRFKIEPPSVPLGQRLQKLGMKTAFNVPNGSANFDRIAPRKPDGYLYISEVFHKAFLALDEEGTEAAAATVVVMALAASAADQEQPVVVRVDRPFLFAIQHVPSATCLFLGRVTDPR